MTLRQFLSTKDPEDWLSIGSKESSGWFFIGTVSRWRQDREHLNHQHLGKDAENDIYDFEDFEVVETYPADTPGEPPGMVRVLLDADIVGKIVFAHEYDPKAWPWKKTEINYEENARMLLMAVVKTAADDYKSNYKLLARMPRKVGHAARMRKAKMESAKHWLLTYRSDGSRIIDVLDIRAHYEMWREDHNCSQCFHKAKYKGCPHATGERFSLWEKEGAMTCWREELKKERKEANNAKTAE